MGEHCQRHISKQTSTNRLHRKITWILWLIWQALIQPEGSFQRTSVTNMTSNKRNTFQYTSNRLKTLPLHPAAGFYNTSSLQFFIQLRKSTLHSYKATFLGSFEFLPATLLRLRWLWEWEELRRARRRLSAVLWDHRVPRIMPIPTN